MRNRTVLYVQYANPAAYPPLQHSAEILAEAGWKVIVLGVSLSEVAGLRFSQDTRITLCLQPPSSTGWRQKLHYVRFCLWALLRTVRHRAGWVYASDPLASPAAWLATWLPGVRVIYHEHDGPGGEPSGFMRRVLSFRTRLLARAKVVVSPNEARGRAMAEQAGRTLPLVCVWNCPRATEAAPEPRGSSDDDRFRVVYHGSIVPARLPRSVIKALSLLPQSVSLRVMGYETVGHRGYIESLQAEADALGIGSRLEVRKVVPTRAELLEAVRASDLGLALMPTVPGDLNEQHMTGASNKAFEYLAQGIPVLVSDLPDWKAMFVDATVARACRPDASDSLSDAISWFVEHRAEARAMGERGRRLVQQEWNYEHQFAPVLAVMNGR